MPELISEFHFTISTTVEKLQNVEDTPLSIRYIDLLDSGKFKESKLQGIVLGEMDQKILNSGGLNPDGRLLLKTEYDPPNYICYTWLRHGSTEIM